MPSPFLDEKVVFQICFVTDDVEKQAKWFAGFSGSDVPPIHVSGARDVAETEYLGEPSDARCKMAFFEFGNTTIELIEPDEHPSCWKDFLDRNGPGVHHIALKVGGMKQKIADYEKSGYPLLQKGEFTGGRYAYLDTEKQLGCLIELLEFDRK